MVSNIAIPCKSPHEGFYTQRIDHYSRFGLAAELTTFLSLAKAQFNLDQKQA